jgi:hypothetical protein
MVNLGSSNNGERRTAGAADSGSALMTDQQGDQPASS